MIEKRIGENIKKIRKKWGFSQIELAGRIGISFQQIQKYEKGLTKISVSRLQQVAHALGMSISVFLEEDVGAPQVSDYSAQYSTARHDLYEFQVLTKEEIKLLKLFRKIENPKLREWIFNQLRGAKKLENQKVNVE